MKYYVFWPAQYICSPMPTSKNHRKRVKTTPENFKMYFFFEFFTYNLINTSISPQSLLRRLTSPRENWTIHASVFGRMNLLSYKWKTKKKTTFQNFQVRFSPFSDDFSKLTWENKYIWRVKIHNISWKKSNRNTFYLSYNSKYGQNRAKKHVFWNFDPQKFLEGGSILHHFVKL